MLRRGFLKRVAATAAGIAIATTPEVEEVTRRWWALGSWRADQSALGYVKQFDAVRLVGWKGIALGQVDMQFVDQEVDPVLRLPTLGDERIVVLRSGTGPLREGDLVEWDQAPYASVRRLNQGQLLGVLVHKDPDNLLVHVQTSGFVRAPSGIMALPG